MIKKDGLGMQRAGEVETDCAGLPERERLCRRLKAGREAGGATPDGLLVLLYGGGCTPVPSTASRLVI